jgi:putative ABC transport system substrate-binding protein
VIVATSHPTAQAAHLATDTVPIVMIASADPVGSGLARSLAHPGGNVTGLSYYATELTEKRLELLHEMVPGASAIGVLSNPLVAYLPFEEDTKKAAGSLNLRLAIHELTSAAELGPTFDEMVKEGVDAVFVLPDLMLSDEAAQIGELALLTYAQRAVFDFELEPSSPLTRRWRGMDSNCQFRDASQPPTAWASPCGGER